MRFKETLTTVLMTVFVLFCACSGDGDKKDSKSGGEQRQLLMSDETFHGWESEKFRNAFIRLDVVPALGGKIMGYEFQGDQILWHDTTREGELYGSEGYGFGESFFNPGGAKVWPAPQGWGGEGEWPGPPDNVLDGSPYEINREDGVITVTSPSDTGEGRSGLRFEHSYSLRKSSSITDLSLSMSNVVDRQVTWGLWHLATVPVDRELTVYVPVDEGDWSVLYGDEDNPQWLGVEDGLFRARYEQRVGKVGMKTREGWAAWHDEENDIVFALMFPVEKGKTYPDGGSNFEIWTSGAGTFKANGRDFTTEYSPESANMELEVLGPLTALKPGENATLELQWGVCRCSGVKRVLSHGVVAEEPVFDGERITAKFGVFSGGYLQEVYFDSSGNQKGFRNVMQISPISELIINRTIDSIEGYADIVRFQIQPFDKSEPGILGEVKIR